MFNTYKYVHFRVSIVKVLEVAAQGLCVQVYGVPLGN